MQYKTFGLVVNFIVDMVKDCQNFLFIMMKWWIIIYQYVYILGKQPLRH